MSESLEQDLSLSNMRIVRQRGRKAFPSVWRRSFTTKTQRARCCKSSCSQTRDVFLASETYPHCCLSRGSVSGFLSRCQISAVDGGGVRLRERVGAPRGFNWPIKTGKANANTSRSCHLAHAIFDASTLPDELTSHERRQIHCQFENPGIPVPYAFGRTPSQSWGRSCIVRFLEKAFPIAVMIFFESSVSCNIVGRCTSSSRLRSACPHFQPDTSP